MSTKGFPICLAGARKPFLNNIRLNLEVFDPKDAVVVDCSTCRAALKK
jgi:Fe-S oxidoreductase